MNLFIPIHVETYGHDQVYFNKKLLSDVIRNKLFTLLITIKYKIIFLSKHTIIFMT